MAEIREVKEISIELLKPYERNAKIHSKEQVEKIANSIKEFGFLSPCLIDKDFNLIAGHGRLMASKKLGLDKIPCVFIEGLTEEQRRAYILADNRLTELGDWDMGLVAEELDFLDDADFDISLTGFELDIEEEEIEVIEDEYTEDVETRCKLGDIWQLGRHRLMCGDSTDINDVSLLMGEKKADMIFTDPPYNVEIVGGGLTLCQR